MRKIFHVFLLRGFAPGQLTLLKRFRHFPILSLGTILFLSLLPLCSFSQTIMWQEDFNNGCTSGCNVNTYTGPNGSWSVTDIGVQGNHANEWFVSCAENGEIVGACGAGCGGNATLHLGSVPCAFCPCGTDCGASYNAGPVIFNINPTTHKRANSPLIDCSGQSGLSLSFKFIGKGQNCSTDYCNLVFSDDGGTTWSNLQTCLVSTSCGNSQGLWTLFNISLPSSADNNANVKLGFEWKNNSDGQGSDPSFALDSMIIYTFTSNVPTANFSTSDTGFCSLTCIDVTDQSTNSPTSWNWSFPGASPNTSALQNPANICYSTSGTYDVTLITGNAYGSDTLTIADYITVFATPASPVITQSNDTLTSSVAYSYQWFMNGNVIPAATNQQLIITQSGDYSVTITDSFGCSASGTMAVVLLSPQSAFNSNAIIGCPGSCFDFTNASLNATSYQWSFPGGNPASSSQQNPPSICYATPGVYDVMLIASSNFASDTLVQAAYITILTPPGVSISQNGNLLSCNPAANTYQWLLNGNQIPGATSQTFLINQTGMYIVEVTDSNGCAAADTLIVNSIPSPDFSVTDTSLCVKFCIDFFDQSSNNPTAWQWIFPGGSPSSSSEQNPANVCYNNPGVYDVTLITNNALGNDTLTLSNYITVNPTPPFPLITQNGYVLTSSVAGTYQWQLNAVDIPGATNQSYTVMQTGIYTVVVGDSNGCRNSASQYVLISAVDEVNKDADIFISPNPSDGNFTVEFTNVKTSENRWVQIKIVNMVGQEVFSSDEKITSEYLSKMIDLSAVTEGVYFLEIKSGEKLFRKKMVIAR